MNIHSILYENLKEVDIMPEEQRNCGCNQNNNNGCGCCGVLGNLFGGNGCCGDSEILFFIIIFLLLFTNFGCCGR